MFGSVASKICSLMVLRFPKLVSGRRLIDLRWWVVEEAKKDKSYF